MFGPRNADKSFVLILLFACFAMLIVGCAGNGGNNGAASSGGSSSGGGVSSRGRDVALLAHDALDTEQTLHQLTRVLRFVLLEENLPEYYPDLRLNLFIKVQERTPERIRIQFVKDKTDPVEVGYIEARLFDDPDLLVKSDFIFDVTTKYSGYEGSCSYKLQRIGGFDDPSDDFEYEFEFYQSNPSITGSLISRFNRDEIFKDMRVKSGFDLEIASMSDNPREFSYDENIEAGTVKGLFQIRNSEYLITINESPTRVWTLKWDRFSTSRTITAPDGTEEVLENVKVFGFH